MSENTSTTEATESGQAPEIETQEGQTQGTPTTTQPNTTEGAPSATTINTEPQAPPSEHMIPKSRFDEVNTALKQLRAEVETEKTKAEDVRKAAERDQAQKDGDLQKQLDLLTADLDSERTKASEAEAKAKQAEIASIRAKIAAKHNLPSEFIDRLVGETEEEIETDVKKLLEAMPTPPPPATQTDGSAGRNSSTPTPAMSEDEIREMAVKHGVKPENLQRVFESKTQH